MATKYYIVPRGAPPSYYQWDVLSNWWNDPGGTIPSATLPANNDTVCITAAVCVGATTSVNLACIYVNNSVCTNLGNARGNTVFCNSSNNWYNYGITCFIGSTNQCVVSGSATFFDCCSINGNTGLVCGNTTFSNNSRNCGRVCGNGTFLNGSVNDASDVPYGVYGVVTGNATFSNYSCNTNIGTVCNNATFSNYSINTGFGCIFGNAIFSDRSCSGGYSSIVGNACLTTGSCLYGGTEVIGCTTFCSGSTLYQSTVRGNASFYDSSMNHYGTVCGCAAFTSYSSNYGGTICLNGTFNNNSNSAYGSTVYGCATFNNNSTNAYSDVYNIGTFNCGSSNCGYVNRSNFSGCSVFNNCSTNSNYGIVCGCTIFCNNSLNSSGGEIIGNTTFCSNASNSNYSIVDGAATIYYPSPRPMTGTFKSSITYLNYPTKQTYITVTPSITASVLIPGYMMDKTTEVYITPVNGSSVTTASNTVVAVTGSYTTNPLVSALFPPLTAYPCNSFNIVNKNELVVNVSDLIGNGYVDIIVANQAGYTKLSDASVYIHSVQI